MDTAKPSRRKTLSERVAAEIRAEMARQQVRNAALAELLGVSEMWVGRKLRGKTPITLVELERFAEVLEVDVDALLAPNRSGTINSRSVRLTGRPRSAAKLHARHSTVTPTLTPAEARASTVSAAANSGPRHRPIWRHA